MSRIASCATLVAVAACLLGCAAAYDNGAPHARLPPVGWSSWVALGPGAQHPIFDYCDEQSVMAAADALASDELGLMKAGYVHFHLDDCWAGGRNSTGYVYAEKDHFPNGMKPVVDYVHSKGLVFGLYTCAGTHTCVGGRPGSKDHWTQDAEVYAEWGVDWVKCDWCNTQGMTPETTYPKLSQAMNATGRPMSLAMCEWGVDDPWKWGDAIAQSWRATGDHTGIWSSTKSIINDVAQIPAEYTGRPYGWNDMDMLETGNYKQAAHANNKESNMTATEYKTEFSMWAIAASPLIVTTPIMQCEDTPAPVSGHCSVALKSQLSHAACTEGVSFGCYANGSMWTSNGCRGEFTCNGFDTMGNADGDGVHVFSCGGKVTCTPTITDLQREILLNTEIIAINQDVTPQGMPVTKYPDISVWARHLTGGDVAVALYNQDDTTQSIGFEFTQFGWSASDAASVRDLWKHADIGTATGKFAPVDVPAHGTVMLRLSKQ